jgi:hypothetical protein
MRAGYLHFPATSWFQQTIDSILKTSLAYYKIVVGRTFCSPLRQLNNSGFLSVRSAIRILADLALGFSFISLSEGIIIFLLIAFSG